MTKKVRVRYAPSPTGFLHIGGARTALFNYLYAKHHDGTFIVRIEDTDVERNVEGGEASQLDNLRWLGIIPEESIDIGGPYAPYRQMERLPLYKERAEKLLANGQVYKCFCSAERLQQSREEQKQKGVAAPHYDGTCRALTQQQIQAKEAAGEAYTLRMRVPEGTYRFHDLVRGNVVFQSKDIGDWVIMKTNGIPTYNFAVALDDYDMDISHVFRGEEHLSNTPKQLMVFEAFGWTPPQYGHMTLIVNEQRKKLSKRDETIVQFVSQYRELGFLPEAMFNFFALLGWSPEGEQELLSQKALIGQFDVGRLSKSVSMFDQKKLMWMNNQYIKCLSADALVELVLPYLQKENLIPVQASEGQLSWVKELALLYQEQLTYGAEIVALTKHYFEEHVIYEDEAQTWLGANETTAIAAALTTALQQATPNSSAEWKQLIQTVQQQTGLKGKALFMPIRILLTGQMHGPELPLVLKLLGKDLLVKRLAQFNKVSI
ncbi:glutamate--tRNA ligase [Lysinibacillus sp. SGAir0095]|uniref:glutamate--tRNA ligase n=1 Tax=Lysinibacillus sp. SGAir0095 TaxID=2070463 RepID=UPI0010CD6A71|nr:glutamate--tRNA ligase [Lysinibacillus sp. SGAir0095]QCR33533.1 glutamate--tRNA ligase [Lysinibacillus sp. SGAir0095]